MDCSVCSNSSNVRALDERLRLYRCDACKHAFTIKRQEEWEIYDDSYFLEKHPNWFANPDYAFFDFINAAVRQYAASERRIRLLDVGCGNGALLRHLARLSPHLELYGIDTSANEDPQIHFIKGDFFTASVPGPFDVICSLMCIEHVDDPRTFVERAHRNLRPGGLLVIATDNDNSMVKLIARWAKVLGIRKAYDRIYGDHHLQHFTNQSLRIILERNGFETLRLRNHNHPMRAVDIPPGTPIAKNFYRSVVFAAFLLSRLFHNGFIQTYVCRKVPD